MTEPWMTEQNADPDEHGGDALWGRVCECGDWENQHEADGRGRCRMCMGSTRPWDHCARFRFSHWEKRYSPADEGLP